MNKEKMLPSCAGDTYESEQHYANMNFYNTKKLPAAFMEGLWWEINENIYDYFLEMMPPIYAPGGFYISEALTGNIHSYYFQKDGRFYSGYANRLGSTTFSLP
jgi:hypothetical protein